MSLVNSLLLYSKYSNDCKIFFTILEQNQVPLEVLHIKPISIDNSQARARVRNSTIQISVVPCLLNFMSNGVVEKYEGTSLMEWLQETVKNLFPPTAPPQPLPPQRPKEVKRVRISNDVTELSELNGGEVEEENEDEKNYEPPEEIDVKSMRRAREVSDEKVDYDKERERNREEYERRKILETGARNLDEITDEVEPKKKRKKKPSKTVNISDITEIDEDDDLVARHRKVPQPKRLRQNDNRYIEDESLFSGEVPDPRQEPRNSIRNTPSQKPSPGMKSAEDPHGTMAKAKALAQGREFIEKETANQSNRPVNPRRL